MSLPDTDERSSQGPRRAARTQDWDTPVYDQVVAEHGRPGDQDRERTASR